MVAAEPIDGPLVEFLHLVPNQRPARRADRAVGGVIPARALRYCEAITSASAFGWYVFLPIDFKVVWDGHDMLWTYDGVDEWLPLTRKAVQYPQFSERFARERARIFTAVPYALHSTRRVADLDRLHRQDCARLEPAGSWCGESFEERII